MIVGSARIQVGRVEGADLPVRFGHLVEVYPRPTLAIRQTGFVLEFPGQNAGASQQVQRIGGCLAGRLRRIR
jgi:hypothetical protein